MDDQRVEIPGSTPRASGRQRWSSAVSGQLIDVSVVLCRSAESGPAQDLEKRLMSGQYRPGSRDEMEQATGADPKDLAAVKAFAEQYGLRVTGENPAGRTIHLEGTPQQMNAAFGIQLAEFQSDEGQGYMSHEGAGFV